MHSLPRQAVSDPDWRTASQALDGLMRKLLVVHRLLEGEERLAEREPRRNGGRPEGALSVVRCLGGADALGRYHGRGRSPAWQVMLAMLVTFLRRSMGGHLP
jgi:hypothetical protein